MQQHAARYSAIEVMLQEHTLQASPDAEGSDTIEITKTREAVTMKFRSLALVWGQNPSFWAFES